MQPRICRIGRREILIDEIVTRNDLTELNIQSRGRGSIVDLTIAAPRLASSMGAFFKDIGF